MFSENVATDQNMGFQKFPTSPGPFQNLLEYIWRTNLDAFWYFKQGTLYNLTLMFSEKVTTGQNMGFQKFPTSPGPFQTYYYGRPQAAIGVLTR